MNIFILNGSPRPRGNTAKMAESFAETARKAGHSVEIVPIGKMEVRGCKNCDACRATLDGHCVQKDGYQAVLPRLADCEVLVIASPIYYYSLSGQIHCAIERLYSYERLPRLKASALLVSAGGSGFEAAVQTYRAAIVSHMGARDLGIVKSAGSVTERTLDEVRSIARKI